MHRILLSQAFLDANEMNPSASSTLQKLNPIGGSQKRSTPNGLLWHGPKMEYAGIRYSEFDIPNPGFTSAPLG
jgi:hypothetical protein